MYFETGGRGERFYRQEEEEEQRGEEMLGRNAVSSVSKKKNETFFSLDFF